MITSSFIRLCVFVKHEYKQLCTVVAEVVRRGVDEVGGGGGVDGVGGGR